MATPTSRASLIEYCMRRLGSPVIEINVDDDQVSDRIDEALQYYQEYHSDAIVKTYLKHIVTAADVTNKYITISDAVTSIVKVLPLGFGSSTWSSDSWQVIAQTMRDFQVGGSVAEYEMSQQNRSMIQHRMGSSEGVRYNRHQNKLHIEVQWGTEVVEDSYIVAEVYTLVDPSEYPSVYNDIFLKQYSTSLIKQQWGSNLIKFEGMVLPGGVTMNGRQLYDDATEEIRVLRENMQLNYELPTDFMIG